MTKSDTVIKCKNCIYFDVNEWDEQICRRAAPAVYLNPDGEDRRNYAYWPLVVAEVDWCGEFKARKEVAHDQI